MRGPPTIAEMKADNTLDGIELVCGKVRCHHYQLMPLDAFRDDDTALTIGRRAVCSKCGHKGASVHPRWKPVPGGGMPVG